MMRAENISKKYPRQTKNANYFFAVNPMSIEIHKGSVTEIIGRSGSGKTTLIHMLAGLITPSEGKVYFGDKDLYSLSDSELSKFRNQYFGVIPQGHTGLFSLTVYENVLLPSVLYKNMESKDEEYAMELLQMLEIDSLAGEYPKSLSGGEIRRMAIARALINRPEVIFADEPTGDLDDYNTEKVLKLFRKLADEGMSVVMVTHESEAKKYCDNIYRMDSGNIKPA